LNSNHPLLFADSGLSTTPTPVGSLCKCHRNISLPICWKVAGAQVVIDNVLLRAVLPLCGLVVWFVDDFESLLHIADTVDRWIVLEGLSPLPVDIRPRLLLVTSNSSDETKGLVREACCIIKDKTVFSSVAIFSY
jgi:hypothetical protein